MKKWKFALVVLLGISSCTKEYDCYCVSKKIWTGEIYSFKSKGGAAKQCADYQDGMRQKLVQPDYTCELR